MVVIIETWLPNQNSEHYETKFLVMITKRNMVALSIYRPLQNSGLVMIIITTWLPYYYTQVIANLGLVMMLSRNMVV